MFQSKERGQGLVEGMMIFIILAVMFLAILIVAGPQLMELGIVIDSRLQTLINVIH